MSYNRPFLTSNSTKKRNATVTMINKNIRTAVIMVMVATCESESACMSNIYQWMVENIMTLLKFTFNQTLGTS